MHALAAIHKRYTEIAQSEASQMEKWEELNDLLTFLERLYEIPDDIDVEWERENPKVSSLYRMIKKSMKD